MMRVHRLMIDNIYLYIYILFNRRALLSKRSYKTQIIRKNTMKHLCTKTDEKLLFSFCRLNLSIPRTTSNLQPPIWWSRKSLKRLPSKKWSTTKLKTLEVSTGLARRYLSDDLEFEFVLYYLYKEKLSTSESIDKQFNRQKEMRHFLHSGLLQGIRPGCILNEFNIRPDIG